jgi:hypothetical protein
LAATQPIISRRLDSRTGWRHIMPPTSDSELLTFPLQHDGIHRKKGSAKPELSRFIRCKLPGGVSWCHTTLNRDKSQVPRQQHVLVVKHIHTGHQYPTTPAAFLDHIKPKANYRDKPL